MLFWYEWLSLKCGLTIIAVDEVKRLIELLEKVLATRQ